MLRAITYLCFNSSSHCTLIRYTSTIDVTLLSMPVPTSHSVTGKNRPEPHPHCSVRVLFQISMEVYGNQTHLQDEAATGQGGSHPGGDQAFSAAAITEGEPSGPIPAEKKMALVVCRRGVRISTSKRTSRGGGSKV